jgi:hypothetical protein
LNRWGTGKFTKEKISQIPDDLKGIYYIYLADIPDFSRFRKNSCKPLQLFAPYLGFSQYSKNN